MPWNLCKLIKLRCYHENDNILYHLTESNGEAPSSNSLTQNLLLKAFSTTAFFKFIHISMTKNMEEKKANDLYGLFQTPAQFYWLSRTSWTATIVLFVPDVSQPNILVQKQLERTALPCQWEEDVETVHSAKDLRACPVCDWLHWSLFTGT